MKRNQQVIVISNEDNKTLELGKIYTIQDVFKNFISVKEIPEKVFPKTCFKLV